MNASPMPLEHVTTVPMHLRFLSGQPGFMWECGFEVRVASPGGRFGAATSDRAVRKATRASFDIADSSPVVGFVGRVVRETGIIEVVTPVVPLEAASITLPVVATHVPGCLDAVGDGEGLSSREPHDASVGASFGSAL